MKNKFLVLLVPIRCIIFILTFFLLSLTTGRPYNALSNWWSLVAIGTNILTLFILYFVLKKEKIAYREILFYEKRQTKVSMMIIIPILMLLVGMSGLYLAGFICYGQFPYLDKTIVEPLPVGFSIVVLLFLPLTTTFAEDGLYLGYAFQICNRRSKWIWSIIVALFYALQHSFIPFLPEARYMIYRFLSFLPLTILICLWYQRKRTLFPIMLGHFLLNIATAIEILYMSICPDVYASLLL